MRSHALALVLVSIFVQAGCSPAPHSEPPQGKITEKAPDPAPPLPAGGLAFVDRVWVVEESNAVAKGSTRVFLTDGTLVLTGPASTPAFGTWKFAEGKLTVVEEGIAYPTDLDEVRGDTLRITMHSPGEPVRMTLRDARPAV